MHICLVSTDIASSRWSIRRVYRLSEACFLLLYLIRVASDVLQVQEKLLLLHLRQEPWKACFLVSMSGSPRLRNLMLGEYRVLSTWMSTSDCVMSGILYTTGYDQSTFSLLAPLQ